MGNTFEIAFLGTNGSCAYNNGTRARYGTNTLCVAVKAGDTSLVFDAGSGICGFNNIPEFQNKELHLFFSHYHIDHMNGLLFWKSLFDGETKIEMYGRETREIIADFFSAPLQPVNPEDFHAEICYHNLKSGDIITPSCDVTVKAMSVSHPNGCFGYRVEYGGKSLCYLTDIELTNHANDKSLIEFAKGTDLLIADSSYPDGKNVRGFGHSTPGECASLAAAAGVKELALYHYGFMLTDEEIDALQEAARRTFKNSSASFDGMRIAL